MNFINTIAQNIQVMVTGYNNRNARSKAVRSALMSLSSAYPEYTGIGFDEQFMTNRASELMQPFLAGGSLPTSDELLTAWASQFPFANESAKKAIANITPMVTEFLYVLESEASSIPVMEQPIVEQPISIPTAPYYIGGSEYNAA